MVSGTPFDESAQQTRIQRQRPVYNSRTGPHRFRSEVTRSHAGGLNDSVGPAFRRGCPQKVKIWISSGLVAELMDILTDGVAWWQVMEYSDDNDIISKSFEVTYTIVFALAAAFSLFNAAARLH